MHEIAQAEALFEAHPAKGYPFRRVVASFYRFDFLRAHEEVAFRKTQGRLFCL